MAFLIGIGRTTPRPDMATSLTAEERWLVALSGPLSAYDGDHVDSIHTGKPDDLLAESVATQWGVTDRDSFLQTAYWLQTEGHRDRYRPLWRAMLEFDHRVNISSPWQHWLADTCFPGYFPLRHRRLFNYPALAASSGLDMPELAVGVQGCRGWIGEIRGRLGVEPSDIPDLFAWDAVRLASLARRAVQLRFIDRREFAMVARGTIAPVRRLYGGWSQVSAAYVAGGLIGNSDLPRQHDLIDANAALIRDGDSPYRVLAFR